MKVQRVLNKNRKGKVYASSNARCHRQRGGSAGPSTRAVAPTAAISESVPRSEQTHEPVNDNHCEGISVCLFLPRNYLQNPLILSQDSVSGSPTSPSNFPPDEVSPSGSPDTSLHNPGNIETHAPDPTDTEDLLGGPNRYDSSHADDDEDTRPPSPGSADHIPPGDVEDLWMQETIHLRDLKSTADFIRGLRDITLDDPLLGMSEEAIRRLRDPPRDDPSLSVAGDTRLAVKLFVDCPSKETYETIRADILDHHPEDDLSSYYKVKRLVSDLTGIESIVHDMCINSCVAYTGPFSELEACPVCSESRYDLSGTQSSSRRERKSRQKFHTIPIGPQIQALYRNPESASHAHYLREERARVLSVIEQKQCLDEYSDVLHGADIIQAFQDGRIRGDDIVLMFSIDGAQLYAQKLSACWIYIWVLLNLSPTRRYQKKHVLIGGFIPGPNNPKNIDSFLFPGLGHLAALQRETLAIWDSALQRTIHSRIFLALITADGPGMMHITGFVGYHGKHGCRLYCGHSGRRERQGKHYFPTLLKPRDYDVEGSSHPDVDIRYLREASCEQYNENLRILVASLNQAQYRDRRLKTGISKPSIFSGIDPFSTLGLPKSAGSDIMHLGALNISDLMISLWRGTIDCTRPDEKKHWNWAVFQEGEAWKLHGKAVADCLHYLPSSFDRPPRNIAEKLTSGYKAWEFLQYLYGLGPGLLLGVLPDRFYTNYCKLVLGMRIMNQHKITVTSVCLAQKVLASFAQEFEIIYCQRLETRIHFVRPCMHSLIHLPQEVIRIGPPICSSQWTLERTIGNLGEEIKKHSDAFENLSQRGLRRARINALIAMIPNLRIDGPSDGRLPHGAWDLGGGFVLLRAREGKASPLRACEAAALCEFLPDVQRGAEISVIRWAKLRLPTGQKCNSAWKELLKPIEKRRTARNIKVSHARIFL